MTKRNEPCPCGSGLKYKKCHGKNVLKGGGYTTKPRKYRHDEFPLIPQPEDVVRKITLETLAIWKELRALDGEEMIRREAIRKQQFR